MQADFSWQVQTQQVLVEPLQAMVAGMRSNYL